MNKTERDFFCWPGTTSNLELYSASYHCGDFWARLCDTLEGGIKLRAPKGKALLMQSCTLHAVRTLVSGWQLAKNFLDAETVVGMSNYVAYGVSTDEWASDSLPDILDNWLLSMRHASVLASITGWKTARGRIMTLFNEERLIDKGLVTWKKQFLETMAERLRLGKHAGLEDVAKEMSNIESQIGMT